jgi:predicted DCC family thiol-disulfide oxidoreductase YuxK
MVKMLLLYDGVCGLCARVTQFVLPRDKHNKFRFAPLQSELAKKLLEKHGHPADALDTFYIVLNPDTPKEKLLWRGRAGLRVLKELGFPWSLMWIFSVLPTFVLDVGYNFVARNRYKWFGKLDQCALPRPEWRHKFIA